MKPRLVCDLSGLTGCLSPCNLQYASLREFLGSLKKGTYLIKLDFKSGFFQLGVHSLTRRYFGTAIRLEKDDPPTSLRHTRLPMGVHSACLKFSAVSAEVRRILLQLIDVIASGVYVDDLYLCLESLEKALVALGILKAILTSMGLIWSEVKTTITPVQEDTILGLTINTVTMTARLPADKQVKTLALALVLQRCAQRNVPVPEAALGELGGRLTWWGTVCDLIPPHTRSLTSFAKYGHGHWRQWRVSAHKWGQDKERQMEELDWLLRRASTAKLMGSTILRKQAYPPQRAICFATDASGESNAIGIVSELGALRISLPDCGGIAIPVLELLAPVLICMHYGEAANGLLIVNASDAMGASNWLANGRARRDEANDLLRLLRAASEVHGFLLLQVWLSRWFNFKADRVAATPVAQLVAERKVDIGLAHEITLRGRPHEFRAAWAQEIYPSFIFSAAAWLKDNSRA